MTDGDGRQRTAADGQAEVRRRYPQHTGPAARFRMAMQAQEQEQPLLPPGYRTDTSDNEKRRTAERRRRHERYDL